MIMESVFASFRGLGVRLFPLASSQCMYFSTLPRCFKLLSERSTCSSQMIFAENEDKLSKFKFSTTAHHNSLINKVHPSKNIVSGDGRDPKILREAFPFPSNSISVIEQFLSARLNLNKTFVLNYEVSSEGFVCKLYVSWPEEKVFTATKRQKKVAKAEVSFQALCWMLENNYIDKKGKPVFHEAKEERNRFSVNLDSEVRQNVDGVLSTYSEYVETAVASFMDTHKNINVPPCHEPSQHPILGIPMPTTTELEKWSEHLQKEKTFSFPCDLPVNSSREVVLSTIKDSRVTVIKGETGCGKSTKIPQFILDEAIKEGMGAFCNIAVAQPRRITAMELAKRVAKERGQSLGVSVGYSVKLSVKYPDTIGGAIMFFTGGKLGQIFINNPLLQGVSHVILDEAHLRDTSTDMLMTFLKYSLKNNKSLKLIIMSATIKADVFQSFYKDIGKVSEVNIPGRAFPVKMHFFDDLPQSVSTKKSLPPDEVRMDVPLAVEVVKWINQTKPAGGMLVFVSGWAEMVGMKKILSDVRNLDVIPVHAMLRDNSSAFAPSPEGKRKVILATNVAETSLTFPDVVYVVDCGVHKKQKRSSLEFGGWSYSVRLVTPISRANVMQRSGRAGRVQPGESYHLFSQEEFDEMDEFEPPGILTDQLERLVLNIKMVSPGRKAGELLSQFPSPPNSKDVRKAVRLLKNARLLTSDECPTPLARIVIGFSSSLPLSIALLYAAIFRCLNLMSFVVAAVESRMDFTSLSDDNSRSQSRAMKVSYNSSSDHIAKGKALAETPSESTFLPTFRGAEYLQTRLLRQVMKAFCGDQDSQFASDVNLVENESEELVRCILLQSPCSILIPKCQNDLSMDLFCESGAVAAVRSGSVNYPVSNKKTKASLLMYFTAHNVGKVLLVDDTTAVSPLAVLLFLDRNFDVLERETDVEITAWRPTAVRIVMPIKDFERIMKLRQALLDIINYFILTEAAGKSGPHDELLNDFRRKLVECVIQMLKVDNCDDALCG